METRIPAIPQQSELFTIYSSIEDNQKEIEKSNLAVPQTDLNKPIKRSINFIDIITVLYFAGCLFFLIKFFITIYKIKNLKGKSKIINENGSYFFVVPDDFGSFSFFKSIYISKNVFKNNQVDSVLYHEKMHVSQYHSIDSIFLAIVKSVQWFNPFIYLMEKELKTVHEYIADSKVIRVEKNKDNYIDVLLNQTLGAALSDLTNNFNSTTILRRLKMIAKPKSPIKRLWIYSLIILPIALSLIFFSCKKQANDSVNTYNVDSEPRNSRCTITTDNYSITYYIDNLRSNGEPKYEKRAEPIIGWEKFFEILKSEQIMPEEAKKNDITAEIWLTYDVNPDGTMTNFRFLNGKVAGRSTWTQNDPGYGLTYVSFKLIKSISQKVKFKPAIINGKPAREHLSLCLSYGDQEIWKMYHTAPEVSYGYKMRNGERVKGIHLSSPDKKLAENMAKNYGKGENFDDVTVMLYITNPCDRRDETKPSFFTDDHFSQIYHSIIYPAKALKEKRTGEVTIRFEVTDQGGVKNAEVENEYGEGFSDEALKAVNSLHGLIVKGFDHKYKRYQIKIGFSLQDNKGMFLQ